MEFLFWATLSTIIYLNIQKLEMLANLEMRHPQAPHLADLKKNFDSEPYQLCGMEWIYFVFGAIIYILYVIIKFFITPPPYRIVTLKKNV